MGMAEHKDCKHFDGCDYRNDIGCCPNWCAQFKHKDDVRVVRCKDCTNWMYEYDDVGLCVADVPDVDGVQRMAYDFCSYAERKGDGNA